MGARSLLAGAPPGPAPAPPPPPPAPAAHADRAARRPARDVAAPAGDEPAVAGLRQGALARRYGDDRARDPAQYQGTDQALQRGGVPRRSGAGAAAAADHRQLDGRA